MKKLYSLVLMATFVIYGTLVPVEETKWEKAKKILTSKLAKALYGIGGLALIIMTIDKVARYLELLVGKKYAALGNEWKMDLKEIYTIFPLLENKLEIIDFTAKPGVLGVSVQENFQQDKEVIEAFSRLKGVYRAVAKYNDKNHEGIQFTASDNAAGPHLTLTQVQNN